MNSKTAKKRQRTKTNQKPSKGNPTSGFAPVGRSRQPAMVRAGTITRLPATFANFPDQIGMRLRTSFALNNLAAGSGALIMSVSPNSTTSSPDYSALGNYFTVLPGLAGQYSRFMVSRLLVQATPTTPATSGGFIAINYEPTNATRSGPPVTVADVLTSAHADVAQVTQVASVEAYPSDYFNAWIYTRSGVTTDAFDIAGVSQILASNSSVTAATVGLVTVEVDIHFAGLRG